MFKTVSFVFLNNSSLYRVYGLFLHVHDLMLTKRKQYLSSEAVTVKFSVCLRKMVKVTVMSKVNYMMTMKVGQLHS